MFLFLRHSWVCECVCVHVRLYVQQKRSWASFNRKGGYFWEYAIPQSPRAGGQQDCREAPKLLYSKCLISRSSSFCRLIFFFFCFSLKLSCPLTRKETELFGLLCLFFSLPPLLVSVFLSPLPPITVSIAHWGELFNKGDPCNLCRHSITWQLEWVYPQMLSCGDENIKYFMVI